MPEIYTEINRRHDVFILVDLYLGNGNGDPDEENRPRVIPQTMQGLITNGCIKRKVRNYVDAIKGLSAPYKIYVQNRGYLIDHKKRAYEAVGGERGSDNRIDEAQAWMCKNYWDIRMFGAVMVGKSRSDKDEGGYNCGQVRGPLQVTDFLSYDPIAPLHLTLTRVALENSGEKPREREEEKATTGSMGRKSIVPYALYKGYGFFNPYQARQTGVTTEDLALFWEALQNMWANDRSAIRGLMSCRGVYIFSHKDPRGCAPAHKLFDLIQVNRANEKLPLGDFKDYRVVVDESGLPDGVTLTKLE